jgi:hypothetical protein
MQEVEFASETLKFAHLTPGPSPQACGEGRTHHLGRRLLIEIGMQPEQWRANVHQRVLNELDQHYVATGRMTIDAWRALNKLLGLRRRADYELASTVRLRHLNHTVALFTRFADECYQILGVS